jgi:hypothetical protein
MGGKRTSAIFKPIARDVHKYQFSLSECRRRLSFFLPRQTIQAIIATFFQSRERLQGYYATRDLTNCRAFSRNWYYLIKTARFEYMFALFPSSELIFPLFTPKLGNETGESNDRYLARYGQKHHLTTSPDRTECGHAVRGHVTYNTFCKPEPRPSSPQLILCWARQPSIQLR